MQALVELVLGMALINDEGWPHIHGVDVADDPPGKFTLPHLLYSSLWAERRRGVIFSSPHLPSADYLYASILSIVYAEPTLPLLLLD